MTENALRTSSTVSPKEFGEQFSPGGRDPRLVGLGVHRELGELDGDSRPAGDLSHV
jgi:hypothetical protein